MKLTNLICPFMLLLLLAVTVNADDPRLNFVGKSTCTHELKSATQRYDIRLDSTQNAHLAAYRLDEANILTIVQYTDDDKQCGVIRDFVQSHDRRSSFVWECVDPRMPSEVVVGTWPENHPKVTGPAVEAWRINLKLLKFAPVRGRVTCKAGNYAGTDEGDSLADWARKRAAKHSSK